MVRPLPRSGVKRRALPCLRRRGALLLLGASLALPGPALAAGVLAVAERLPLVQPRAARARERLRPLGDGLYRVDAEYALALAEAEGFWSAQRGDEALVALSRLQTIAPLHELPFVKAHLMLAALADARDDRDLRNHHRAFALALVRDIEASGTGHTRADAMRLVLPSEVDAWLMSREPALTLVDRRRDTGRAHSFDILRVREPGGREREVWFDLSVLQRPAVAAR